MKSKLFSSSAKIASVVLCLVCFGGFLGFFLWGLFSFCLGFSFFLFLFFCRVLSDYISMIALKLYIASRLSHLCSGCWWDRCVSNMASLKREDPMKLHAAR